MNYISVNHLVQLYDVVNSRWLSSVWKCLTRLLKTWGENLSILQTTSAPDFNTYFKQLGLSLRQVLFFQMSCNDLLTSANTSTQYREMLKIGTWKTPPSRASNFKADQDTPSGGDGGGGGLVGDPLYGASLCQRCHKSHSGQCPIPHWKRTPQDDSPTSVIKNEKTYYWCKRCMGWNITHLTEEHLTCVKIARENPQAALASNLTDDNSVSSGGETAHFTAYKMRALCPGAPTPSFASTVRGELRGGLQRGTHRLLGNWFPILDSNLDYQKPQHLHPQRESGVTSFQKSFLRLLLVFLLIHTSADCLRLGLLSCGVSTWFPPSNKFENKSYSQILDPCL